MTTFHSRKRRTLGLLLGAALATASLPSIAEKPAAADPLRIGFQKYGTLIILKAKGNLEKRLAPLGVEVKWTEFPAGPQLLEGLNVGSIDFGTVGEAPPIFAQAAGADLVYVANEPPAPASEAILVPKDSPIKSVADLKGRKVALKQGLERSLPAREGAGEERARVTRTWSLCSCPRPMRAQPSSVVASTRG